MRSTNEIVKLIDRFGKLKADELDVADQMKFIIALEDFADAIEPIVEKYDPTKPFTFEIRRLDKLL